jgi:1-acyl-sn-glycerol-3-phosphate acyltransferase
MNAIRFAGFFAWTIVIGLSRCFLRGPRWRRRLLQAWSRVTLRLVGIRLRVTGRGPEPPFLLVSNHVSYVDIALLAGQLDTLFVAKRDVRRWPILGPIIAGMDTIFVDREHPRDLLRVNTLVKAALDRGEGVVIFAEGTSSPGEAVLPLKPSLLEVAAQHRLPVHYACVSYNAPEVAWWGDMEFVGHFFEMLKLPAIDATLTFGPGPIIAKDRKLLARRLHQAISEHLPWPTLKTSSATTFAASNKA